MTASSSPEVLPEPGPESFAALKAGTQDAVYVPSDIKRSRRTKAAVLSIRDAIREVLEQDHPQTVRQVFYALTVRGVIKKQEIEYHRTVIRLLVDMRESGEIPFDWLADNTRWQRKPATFVGLDSCLNKPPRPIAATSGPPRRSTWKSGARRMRWQVS